MSRAFRIDLRRSSAVGAGLLLLGLGVLAMYLLGGWAGRWTAVALSQREYLTLLWPLTLAAGAWLVGRDRRGRVDELFAATPRPAWQRYAPPAAALALTVSLAYVLTLAACLPLLLGREAYFNPVALLIIAVGAVSLVAAGLLGMAVGRLLPSRMTAPAVALAGLFVTLLPVLVGRSLGTGRLGAAAETLPPSLLDPLSDFDIVPGRVSAAQLIWMAALAVTGYLLLTASSRLGRLGAVLPAALGLAVVLPMLPGRYEFSAVRADDPGSVTLVCTADAPKVCVTRVHAGTLPEVTGIARTALDRLSVLPGAPDTVVEDSNNASSADLRANPAVIGFYLMLDQDGSIFQRDYLELQLLESGVVPGCPGGAGTDPDREVAAARAAAYWLAGAAPPAPAATDTDSDVLAREAFAALSALPRDQAQARVAAVRRASLDCDPDLLAVLTGRSPA